MTLLVQVVTSLHLAVLDLLSGLFACVFVNWWASLARAVRIFYFARLNQERRL